MAGETKTAVVSARLPAALAAAVAREAARRGVTETEFMRQAIERALEPDPRPSASAAAIGPADRLLLEYLVGLRRLAILMLGRLHSPERAEIEIKKIDEAVPARVTEILKQLEAQ